VRLPDGELLCVAPELPETVAVAVMEGVPVCTRREYSAYITRLRHSLESHIRRPRAPAFVHWGEHSRALVFAPNAAIGSPAPRTRLQMRPHAARSVRTCVAVAVVERELDRDAVADADTDAVDVRLPVALALCNDAGGARLGPHDKLTKPRGLPERVIASGVAERALTRTRSSRPPSCSTHQAGCGRHTACGAHRRRGAQSRRGCLQEEHGSYHNTQAGHRQVKAPTSSGHSNMPRWLDITSNRSIRRQLPRARSHYTA